MNLDITDDDLDRLADYAAGVLDSSEAAEIDELIQSRQEWRSAFEALVAADHVVRDELRSLAIVSAEPMPTSVSNALSTTLRAASAGEPPSRLRLVTPSEKSGSTDSATVTSLNRARRRRLFVGLSSVAASVVLVAGGLWFTGTLGVNVSADTAAAPGSGQTAGRAEGLRGGLTDDPTALSAGISYLASGVNYTPDSLTELITTGAAPTLTTDQHTGDTPPKVSTDGEPDGVRVLSPERLASRVDARLVRMTDPDAMSRCLNAVTPGHPGVVTAVDFARLNGAPALVMVIRSGNSTEVVAVGPACGVNDDAVIMTIRQ